MFPIEDIIFNNNKKTFLKFLIKSIAVELELNPQATDRPQSYEDATGELYDYITELEKPGGPTI